MQCTVEGSAEHAMCPPWVRLEIDYWHRAGCTLALLTVPYVSEHDWGILKRENCCEITRHDQWYGRLARRGSEADLGCGNANAPPSAASHQYQTPCQNREGCWVL
jgi:hypothetical protein